MKLFFLSLVLLVLVPTTQAQTRVTDTDLENFIRALYEIRSINFQSRAELSKVVVDEGYSLDEFEVMYQAHLDNDQAALAQLTNEELQQLNRTIVRLEAIESYYDKVAEEAIQKHITLDLFDEISYLLDTDPTVLKRFQDILNSLD
jgi:hypothetical protein